MCSEKTGVNPTTYGILRFPPATGGGGGGFLAQTQETKLWLKIDLKFGTNNGTDDTSKHAKFKHIKISPYSLIAQQL